MPISPALNCKMRAASMLFTCPSPLVSAAPGQVNEPSKPAVSCKINAASIEFTPPLQSTSPIRPLGGGVGVAVLPSGGVFVGVSGSCGGVFVGVAVGS